MRFSLIPVLALVAVTATGCLPYYDAGGGGGGSDATITIDNGSAWVLYEVRVAAVDQVSWGPNLLADVLYPNEQLTVAAACGSYDVLIADEHRRECILTDMNLCRTDSFWTVDNTTLRYCGF